MYSATLLLRTNTHWYYAVIRWSRYNYKMSSAVTGMVTALLIFYVALFCYESPDIALERANNFQ